MDTPLLSCPAMVLVVWYKNVCGKGQHVFLKSFQQYIDERYGEVWFTSCRKMFFDLYLVLRIS